MLIEVRQNHIDNGVKNDCGGCPIALAIKEQTIFKTARVSGSSWRTGFTSSQYILLPESARMFVRFFDSALSVEPFTFELQVPA